MLGMRIALQGGWHVYIWENGAGVELRLAVYLMYLTHLISIQDAGNIHGVSRIFADRWIMRLRFIICKSRNSN